MANDTRPVAVFDSGVGGISVLRELVRLMPNENFIYFGDSKNAPYGTKSTHQVQSLTEENVRRLLDMGAKAVVIACNTATAAAVVGLREKYPRVPVIGIEPAIKPAASAWAGGTVVVMATPVTLAAEKFNGLAQLYKAECSIVSLPCPGLVEYVERGELDGPEVEALLRSLLREFIAKPPAAVVLGCTHYPFLRPVISRLLKGTAVFDGSLGTARETQRRLEMAGLSAPADAAGRVDFFSSLSDPAELELYRRLLEVKLT